MNVGLDMRLVNTSTLEVADVISYQKQIIGRQISAGVFDFLGANFFDISGGESALEPIQLAVRAVIERAVLEMVTRIYRVARRRLRFAHRHRRGPAGRAPYPYQAYAQPSTAYIAPTLQSWRVTMPYRVKTLIAATALATLSATWPTRGISDQYGTWNDGSSPASQIGSKIVNAQINHADRNGQISTATSTRLRVTPPSRAPPQATWWTSRR